MALYARILSRPGSLPTHWSYSDLGEESAEGFQVWISLGDALRAAGGKESDGDYSPASGYAHIALIDVGEADPEDGGAGPWFAFRPEEIEEARQIEIGAALALVGDLADLGDDELTDRLWAAATPFEPEWFDPRA